MTDFLWIASGAIFGLIGFGFGVIAERSRWRGSLRRFMAIYDLRAHGVPAADIEDADPMLVAEIEALEDEIERGEP